MPKWKHYEYLKPDELELEIIKNPIAYWPLGLIEHHGWHLPIGFDGIKASEFCKRLASKNGGLMIPTMWWGGGGGHDVFKWTHYQDLTAVSNMLDITSRQLLDYGVKVLILFAGHYPWQNVLDSVTESLKKDYRDRLILAGTEKSICGDDTVFLGDHAAKEETSWGLSLFPKLIDMTSIEAKHDYDAWPPQGPPAKENQHPKVNYDPQSPQFAQMGEDARKATAKHGETMVNLLIEKIDPIVKDFLKKEKIKINTPNKIIQGEKDGK